MALLRLSYFVGSNFEWQADFLVKFYFSYQPCILNTSCLDYLYIPLEYKASERWLSG